MLAGQEPRTPQTRGDKLRRAPTLADHHDERREVFIHAAEAVADPSAKRRTARQLVAGLEKRHAGFVVDLLGEDRVNHAEVLRAARGVRVELGNPEPVLVIVVFFKFENRGRDGQSGLARGHAGNALVAAHGFREVFVELVVELWLVVEEIHLRRATVLEEVDDPLGLRRKVRRTEESAFKRARRSGREEVVSEHGAERHGADTLRHFSEKLTPSDVQEVVFDGISHSFILILTVNRSWWFRQS